MSKKTTSPLSSLTSKVKSTVSSALPRIGKGDQTNSLITTPWAWRTDNGMYVGHGGDVWMYRTLPCSPTLWEDPNTQLDIGTQLSSALYDLASTSKDLGVGIRALSKSREVHLLSLTWDEPNVLPSGTNEALGEFISDALDMLVPHRAVVLGVRLWASSAGTEDMSIVERARNLSTAAMSEVTPEFAQYQDDLRVVESILARYDITGIPDRRIRRRMEAWYNDGKHADASLYEMRDSIATATGSSIEMSAVMAFNNPIMQAPAAMWGFAASTGADCADVVSVRCALEPSSIARSRIRRAERKVLSQIEEEEATGDLERAEFTETFELAKTVENYIISGDEPLLTDCSIVMAREIRPGSQNNYMDRLESQFGIEMKPLEHRQIPALQETLPCGVSRVNPFLQDISVSMLAHAGVQSFSNLGDNKGAFLGLVDPDYTPCYLDPLGAPAANKPPAMLVAGEPGSGKTFTAQMLAVQSALAGYRTVFINPKSDDTLEGLTDLVDGKVVRLTEIEEQGGYFDPFRFAGEDEDGRNVAAQILVQHILAVLGSRGVAGQGFTQEQEIAVTSGIAAGAKSGARCAAEAIAFIEDESLQKLIFAQASDPLFALGIGMVPAESYAESGQLLLVEFDKPLDIPESGVTPAEYTRSQRLAVAAVRLVTRASLELLGNSDGGVIIVDEAWMYLQSSAGLAALQSIGRLGRSKNILPIFCTQRVDDVLKSGVDMQSYLSRVLCMKLTDPREARAALQLCGLEATQGRIDWLRSAGAIYSEDGELLRGAMGLHKDLYDRHAAVEIGPLPEYAREAFSTNPEDRRRRREARDAAIAKASAEAAEELLQRKQQAPSVTPEPVATNEDLPEQHLPVEEPPQPVVEEQPAPESPGPSAGGWNSTSNQEPPVKSAWNSIPESSE